MSRSGGGLLMVGGYYSFQGINGGARYHGTPVEEALPVEILPYDDRVEAPEGFTPVIKQEGHPILGGLAGEWPPLLGFNEVRPKPGASVLATVSADYGESRCSLPEASARDVRSPGPPTSARTGCPPEFAAWTGYARLWRQSLEWLVEAR